MFEVEVKHAFIVAFAHIKTTPATSYPERCIHIQIVLLQNLSLPRNLNFSEISHRVGLHNFITWGALFGYNDILNFPWVFDRHFQ